jgi:hypothetical protein
MNNFAATNTSKSGLVQSHSVTAQFNALSVDVENFRNDRQVAQENHGKVQEGLNQLKKEQAAFLSQIRMEQEGLGTRTRKRDMFGNEKARLNGVNDRERKALEACAKHTKALSDKAADATRRYNSAMAEPSNEVAGCLQREIQSRTNSFLSANSVQAVATPKVPSDPKFQQYFYQGFQIMRNGEETWKKERTRHPWLRSKYDDAPLEGPLLGGTGDAAALAGGAYAQQQMDLFYGLSTGNDDAAGIHA